MRFNFAANVGVQQVAKQVDLPNRDQYLGYLRDSFANGNRTILTTLQAGAPALPDTDWQKEVFRWACKQQYSLSAAGGTAKSRFYVSGGCFNQEGVVKNAGFEYFSLRANYDAQLTSKLRLGLSMAPNFTRNKVLPVSGSYNGGNISGGGPGGETAVVTSALILAPIIPARLGLRYGGALCMSAIAPGVFLTKQKRHLMLEADGTLTDRARRFMAHTPSSASASPTS